MYSPEAFRERRPEVIAELMRQHSLATLISVDAGLPVISHIPLMFEPGNGDGADRTDAKSTEHGSAGCNGRLLGHLARANPHAPLLADGAPVTAIFHGPDAYVSPHWYQSPGVPTWNYAVVHVSGHSRLIDDDDRLLQLLDQLSARHEPSGKPIPLPQQRRRPLLQAIVGFEIHIDRIDAKFKLSQNRPDADQPGILAGLEGSGPGGGRLAGLMRQTIITDPR